MSEPPYPASAADWALFLDLDGTLAEIAPNPDAVHLPPAIVACLERLQAHLGGALALVSGRPMDAVDRLTDPAQFPVAGIHGAEWRDVDGHRHRVPLDPAMLDRARGAFGTFAARHPGTWAEDKGIALGLHYRAAPAAGAAAAAMAERVAEEIGPSVAVLRGKMIVELRARDATKAHAVDRYLEGPPFAGRRPVYVGDDVTDEDAFRAVNARDGISVLVGDGGAGNGTAARYRLPSVTAVYEWLEALDRHLGGRDAKT